MSLLRVGSGAGVMPVLENDFFNRRPHLMGAGIWVDSPDTHPQTGERHRRNLLARQLPGRDDAKRDEQQRGTSRKVWLDRIRQHYWHPHRWCRNDIRNTRVQCLDSLCCADQHLSEVTVSDQLLQTILNFPAEESKVELVDATVHESEVIGRAVIRIDVQIKDGPAIDFHVRQATATWNLTDSSNPQASGIAVYCHSVFQFLSTNSLTT
jgi:hypothetical protein